MTGPAARRSPAVRWFSGLLYAYPAAFRTRFGAEMSAAFEASLAQARAIGAGRVAWLVIRSTCQMLALGAAERARRLTPGRAGAALATAAFDFRIGLRQIRRRPRVSMLAIGVLAIGFAAATVSFSVLRGTVLRGLPFEDAHELVHFERQQLERNLPVTPHDLADWRVQQTTFVELAAFVEALALVEGEDLPTGRHEGVAIEPAAFPLLRAGAAHGRVLQPADAEPGASPVILLSDRFWRARFGADPAIVGRDVIVNGSSTRVVGVMPPGFGFPIAEDFWVPLAVDPGALPRGQGRLDVFGRLRPGVTFDQAVHEFDLISARLAAAHPENRDVEADLKTFQAEYVGDEFVANVRAMVVGAIIVLLIATINVGNLLLARQLTSRQDQAVRIALGATRGRLLGLAVGEAAALAGAGAAVGIALGAIALGWLRQIWNDISVFDLPHGPAALFWWDVRLDPAVVAFVGGCLLASALVAGVVPAWWLSRSGRQRGLADTAGRGRVAGAGRVAEGLVVLQLALMTSLIVPVVLAAGSATSLSEVTARFGRDDVQTVRVSLPAGGPSFARALQDRLDEDPRLESAAVATALPFHAARAARLALPDAPEADDAPNVRVATVAPGYFELFDAAPVAGRPFDATDRAGADPVVIVNESFAARFFESGRVLGTRIRLGDAASSWRTVVGVVPDLWMDGDRNRDRAGAYVPLAQDAPEDSTWRGGRWGAMFVLARSRGESRDAEHAIREAAAGLDRSVAVFAPATMRQAVGERAGRFAVFGAIYGILGVAALGLAVVGVYGVSAFLVARRTREIGVRMALGASRSNVLRQALARAAVHVAVGVAIGLVFAGWLSDTLSRVLFAVDPAQPWAYVTAAAVVISSGVIACLPPARRAASVDPLTALRRD